MEVFKVFDSEIIQKYSPDMFLVCWNKASPLTVFFPPCLSRTSGTHSQLRSDTALKFIFLIHVIKLHGGIRERHKKKKKRRLERKNSNHSTSKWQNVSVESVLTCLEFKLPTKKTHQNKTCGSTVKCRHVVLLDFTVFLLHTVKYHLTLPPKTV